MAGLAAGVYAASSGLDVDLFEAAANIGGVCTSWERAGFVIDGCLHYVNAGACLRIWQETGAITHASDIVLLREFKTFIDEATGRSLTITGDLDSLERDMISISPRDASLSRAFVHECRLAQQHDIGPLETPIELLTLPKKLQLAAKMAPVLVFLRRNLQSCRSFASKFHDRFLASCIENIFLPDFPLQFAIFLIGSMGRLFRPLGGSGQFTRGMAAKLTALGGRIHTGSKVERIVVDHKGRVEGVVVRGTSETFKAEAVIAACDLHLLMNTLLQGQFHDHKIDKWLRDMPLFPTACIVSHCIEGPVLASGNDIELSLRLKEPVELAGSRQQEALWIRVMQQPLAMQRQSIPRTVVQTLVISVFEYWQRIAAESREKYNAAKADLGKQVFALIAPHLYGLANSGCTVIHVDVATPLTFQRYTSGWRGSFEGFAIPPGRSMMPNNLSHVSGVKGLYLAGQWCCPGGGVLPSATTARDAVQYACRDLHIPFVAPPAAFTE